jgi:hypothetical protein
MAKNEHLHELSNQKVGAIQRFVTEFPKYILYENNK